MTRSADACGVGPLVPPASRRGERRVQRQREIHEQACRLVLERGYDGFTMDELAEAVGVSRRTLFNLVSDKAAAVLGIEDETQQVAIDEFLAGGPTGVLLDDVLAVIDTVLAQLERDDPGTASRLGLRARAITQDAKTLRLATEHVEGIAAGMERELCRRENWPEGDLRARVLSRTAFALVLVALEEVTAGREPSLHQAFRRVAQAAAGVAPQRTPSPHHP